MEDNNYYFSIKTLPNKPAMGRERVKVSGEPYEPILPAEYCFEVDFRNQTVEVMKWEEIWKFRLHKTRLVGEAGNNHLPEGVKSVLEQIAGWMVNTQGL